MWKLLLLVAVNVVFSEPPCPEGSVFNSDFNKCYKIVNEPEDNWNAGQKCVHEGGKLALIENEEQNAFLAALVQSSNNAENLYFWIGNTVSTSNYTKWASGQGTLRGCTSLTPCGGFWAKVDCPFAAPYICQMEPTSCPECPTCPALHSYCDSEWAYFQESDSCYKGFFDSDWHQANSTCVEHGANLASIHSDIENQFIYNLVTMNVNGSYSDKDMTWFGLYRLHPGTKDKTFVYTDGTTFNTTLFNKWAPNDEPNNKNNNENCAQLTSDIRIVTENNQQYDYTGLWNDANCSIKHRRFVCKKAAYHG